MTGGAQGGLLLASQLPLIALACPDPPPSAGHGGTYSVYIRFSERRGGPSPALVLRRAASFPGGGRMPAQPVPPGGRRRGVSAVFVDVGPLRRHRDFRRLWGGQLVSQVGSQLTIVAVAYQTYRLTGSTAMVGLVSLGQLLPLLAGSLLGGPLLDAWDRRRVLLATQLLLAAGGTGLAVNSMLPHPLLWPMFACTAESAAFQGVDWAARRTSLRRLVPPADLAAAVSVQSAGFQ